MEAAEQLTYTLACTFSPEDMSQVAYWAEQEETTPEKFVYNATINRIIKNIEREL